MSSESPFDRLGARALDAPRRARTIKGGENPLGLAHAELGEWRAWRELLDFNAVADPFDLTDATHSSAPRLLIESALVDTGGIEDVDLAAEIGVGASVVWASPELSGRGELEVTDSAPGSYTLAFRAPGEGVAGAPLKVTDADLVEADGSARSWRGLLMSASGRYALDLGVTPDAWLVLWLARCAPIDFAPTPARSELLIPELI